MFDTKKIRAKMKNAIHTDNKTGLEYFSGYSYNTLYDWDQYFESLLQIYCGYDSKYIRNGVLIFLEHMEEDGFIARHIPIGVGPWQREHVKPFLCQICLLAIRFYDEKEWILNEDKMNRLEKYLRYWIVQMDQDGNGLSEWMSAPHSGMDNQHARAGYWDDFFCEGADLNSYLAVEFRAYAQMCELYGDERRAAEFSRLAQERADSVNRILWNAESGFYFDRNVKAGNNGSGKYVMPGARLNEVWRQDTLRYKSVSGFMPMWAGIADKDQARTLVTKHLLDPEEFWTAYPVSVQSKDTHYYTSEPLPFDLGCCWRANVWVPANWLIVQGCMRYGYDIVAQAIIEKTAELVQKSGDREYYAAADGAGCGLNPFYGWTLLAYFMQYEKDSGIWKKLIV